MRAQSPTADTIRDLLEQSTGDRKLANRVYIELKHQEWARDGND